MSYQTMFELLKPFFTFIGYILAICMFMKCLFFELCCWFAENVFLEFGIAFIAEYFDPDKNLKMNLKRIPYIIVMTLIMFVYQVPITISRLYGIISFNWRRMAW